MANEKGFRFEVTSRYDRWRDYDVALVCGCFDAADKSTAFVSARTSRPEESPAATNADAPARTSGPAPSRSAEDGGADTPHNAAHPLGSAEKPTSAEAAADLAPQVLDAGPAGGTARLSAPACHHALLYLYIIPHRLPESNDIETTHPFDVTLKIAFASRTLRTERLKINRWSGISLELRLERPE